MRLTIKTLQLTVVASTVFIMTGCSSKKDTSAEPEVAAAPVSVVVAVPKTIKDNSMELSGQVVSAVTANISTRIMGTVSQLTVKVGDVVQKGQVLVKITHDDISSKKGQTEAMIAEAEAACKNAEKDVERFKNLYKQQSATAKEVENVTLQFQSMKAKLEAAKQMRNEVDANLAYTTLTAPFAGVVSQKFMEAGGLANPGMPILTIEQSGSIEIAVNVPESEIQSIKMNGLASVVIKSLDKKFNATVIQIAPSSQFTGGQYVIKLEVPEKEKAGLHSGMYANVAIPLEMKATNKNTDAVLVPVSSILYKDQLTGIYAVSKNHTALLRWVRLGKVSGDEVEVLSGLAADEQFVLTADGKLFNGAAITEKK